MCDIYVDRMMPILIITTYQIQGALSVVMKWKIGIVECENDDGRGIPCSMKLIQLITTHAGPYTLHMPRKLRLLTQIKW